MNQRYRLIERTPTVETYNYIRTEAGMSQKDEVAARHGLAGTLYVVCVEHEGRLVGIGRVIGDGGLFFDIVDIAVLPAHQKQGLGRMIMEALMAYIHANACPTAFVGLMADAGVAPFYERFGFSARHPEAPGMFQIIG